jgi:hypothetical protein
MFGNIEQMIREKMSAIRAKVTTETNLLFPVPQPPSEPPFAVEKKTEIASNGEVTFGGVHGLALRVLRMRACSTCHVRPRGHSMRVEERPPPTNIMNKQPRTNDNGWSPSLGLGRAANNSSP